MGIHDGHRQRVYDRFRKEGLDSFSPHNVLELLLFYSIPRSDTNEIAHRLIERFGSLSAVFEAPESELVKVDGIGERSALLLKMIPDIARYYMVDKTVDIAITSPDQAAEYLLPRYIGRSVETVMVTCLDNKNKVLNTSIVHEGSINVSEVSVQAIASAALQSKAAAIVLSHNHPDGVALPSNDDILTTKLICRTLSALNIRVLDHIIIGDNDYVSLVRSGKL